MNYNQRAGKVLQVFNLKKISIDASCWLSDEILYLRFNTNQHLLKLLKRGDWVLFNYTKQKYLGKVVGGTEIYNLDCNKIERTTITNEIKRLENLGKTDCGLYISLIKSK